MEFQERILLKIGHMMGEMQKKNIKVALTKRRKALRDQITRKTRKRIDLKYSVESKGLAKLVLISDKCRKEDTNPTLIECISR